MPPARCPAQIWTCLKKSPSVDERAPAGAIGDDRHGGDAQGVALARGVARDREAVTGDPGLGARLPGGAVVAIDDVDPGLGRRAVERDVGEVVLLGVRFVPLGDVVGEESVVFAAAGSGERRAPDDDVHVVGVEPAGAVAAGIGQRGAGRPRCEPAVGIGVEHAVSRGQHDQRGDQRPTAEDALVVVVRPAVPEPPLVQGQRRLPRVARSRRGRPADDACICRAAGRGRALHRAVALRDAGGVDRVGTRTRELGAARAAAISAAPVTAPRANPRPALPPVPGLIAIILGATRGRCQGRPEPQPRHDTVSRSRPFARSAAWPARRSRAGTLTS